VVKSGVQKIGPIILAQGLPDSSDKEDRDTLVQSTYLAMVEVARLDGVAITVDRLVALYFMAEERARLTAAICKNYGIKPELRRLLAATKKKEALKIAKTLRLSIRDLTGLTLNCAELGLRRRFFTKEFHPERLGSLEPPKQLTIPGEKKFTPEGAQWSKRMHRLFEERKQLFVHLYEGADMWHFFIFTPDDLKGNHGNYGGHLHYTSHLWNIPKEETFKSFETRGERPPSVHVSFDDIRGDYPSDPKR